MFPHSLILLVAKIYGMAPVRKRPPRDDTDLLGSRLGLATIRFHSAVAASLGLSLAEAKAWALLQQEERLTAGELARRLGLTTGAVTGLVDRLEAAALVRRVPDASDRRRILVER